MNKITPSFYFTFFFIIIFSSIDAQTAVSFSYDAAGNRILRKVITLKSAKIMTDTIKNANNIDSINNLNTSPKNDVAFEDNLDNKKITIYPNPTKGELKVEIENYEYSSNSGLYVYDVSGKLLIRKSPANSSTTIDLSGYQTGIYILKIIIDDKKSEWKIIKE